jgi:hypothetical protein
MIRKAETVKRLVACFLRTMSALVCLLVLSFSGLPALAQKDSLGNTVRDNGTIVKRYPSKESLDKFRSNRDYDYNRDIAPPNNPFAKWIAWLKDRVNSFFSSESYDDFWQYVIIILTVTAVIYLLYKAKVLNFIWPSKAESEPGKYMVVQENIHEINFDEAIQVALGNQDFRLAVRLQYLQILKLLTSRNLIHWKPNLTNQTYVQELEKTKYHSDFAEITRYFEFSWYGDFDIDESGFREMKAFTDLFAKNVENKQ